MCTVSMTASLWTLVSSLWVFSITGHLPNFHTVGITEPYVPWEIMMLWLFPRSSAHLCTSSTYRTWKKHCVFLFFFFFQHLFSDDSCKMVKGVGYFDDMLFEFFFISSLCRLSLFTISCNEGLTLNIFYMWLIFDHADKSVDRRQSQFSTWDRKCRHQSFHSLIEWR